MAEPFLGQVMMTAFPYAPRGWALCSGQQMPISQYSALFSLLRTFFGGDGTTYFSLPDLTGRMPMHWSPTRIFGQSGGSETVTLDVSQMPQHRHAIVVNEGSAGLPDPKGNFLAATSDPNFAIYRLTSDGTMLNPQTVAVEGGGGPHENMPPYLALNFCIAVEGIFPDRS